MKFSIRLLFIFIVFAASSLYFLTRVHQTSLHERETKESKRDVEEGNKWRPPSLSVSSALKQNRPSGGHSGEVKFFNKIFGRTTLPPELEQFTIVMMTYKRAKLLRNIVPHYCTTGEKLQKILIIWNDLEEDVPQDLKEIECEVRLQFIISKENKLTNRFIPYSEIETDAVFCIDDDRRIIHEDLNFAFTAWQELRHKILGFERRTHTVTNGSYRYGENTDTLRKLGYSMVLSTNFILHKAYLEMFQIPEFLPKGIYRYVDVKMNCEDFAMAIMVTDFFERVSSPQSCCIVLKGKRFPYNLEEENDPDGYKGLSKRGGRHYSERTECLNYFKAFYKDGRLPLRHTHVKIIHEPNTYYHRQRRKIELKES